MTTVDDWAAVHAQLDIADALLLDFDGPICSVFAGFPAEIVADQLRQILHEGGCGTLPECVRETSDPFDVLHHAAVLGSKELSYVEAAFTAHECEAIQTARPTPGAHAFIRLWHNTGRPLAIVSNNSRAAVEAYVLRHNIFAQVTAIAARDFTDLDLLKPSPYLVQSALSKIGVGPERAVFIGDSVTDLQAGQAAGVVCVAFANRPDKVAKLGRIADHTVTGFRSWS